ncbi:MAG: DUF1772 domain-containing protein [Micromonosporaceae bacterium]
MGNTLRVVALVAATLTTGLAAGLFAAFSYAVMPGLRRTDDRTMVGAMQQINTAILNGWFALCFGGAVLFTALAAVLHLGYATLPWIVAGLVFYVATLVITFRINVPLNNALDAAGTPDEASDLAAVRRRFETPWIRWNWVRTATNLAAFGCLAWALVLYGRITTGG